ncbi:hypothetical protein [Archaeoglobus neptunius]|uniref:hypothetical protein n=1 Tax=Archaeoglobus neptunius TaxID=2798580 RepID=UPI0019254AAF|nr:hypothetical protein [Archaeoglobus neptunius]
MADPFNHSEYIFYKYAGAVGVFDGDGNSIMYAEREGVSKIGKPIHVYTSKYRTKELLTISSPKIWKESVYISWPITPPNWEYHVTDVAAKEDVGSIVQKSRIRITRDDWLLISRGITVGRLKSIRYWLHSLIWPRKYKIIAQDGREVGTFEQHREILNFKYTMTITEQCIDTRLLVAAGIIITALNTGF